MKRKLLNQFTLILAGIMIFSAAAGGCGNSSKEKTDAASQNLDPQSDTPSDVPNNETDTSDTTEISSSSITLAEAEQLLTDSLGTEDTETGNTYSFGYIDDCTIDGVDYYAFQWAWLVNGDHMSRIGDLMVKTDGSGIYEGVYSDTESSLSSDNNLLKK